MLFGNALFGQDVFGGDQVAIQGSTINVPLPDQLNEDIYSPAPYLHFLEVETSSGNFLRVVDFGDSDEATTGEINFDGHQWTVINLGLPEYETDLEGRLPNAVIAVNDPTRSILAFVKANDNFKDSSVKTRIIRHDQISTPSLSDDRLLRVKQIQSLEGPSRVQFVLGPPNLFDLGFPIVSMNRYGCHHVFERRFLHNKKNFCSYPSDEFEVQTTQWVAKDTDDNKERQFGWHTTRALNGWETGAFAGADLSGADINAVENGRNIYGLKLENNKNHRLIDTDKEAGTIWKRIFDSADSNPDFDVQTRIIFNVTYCKEDQFSGIIIESENDPSTWFLAGFKQTADAEPIVYDLLKRVTSTGVSTDTNLETGVLPHNAIRVARSGSNWTIYSRQESVSKSYDDSNSWTTQDTFSLSIDGPVRVGLVNCHALDTQDGTQEIHAYFYHLRFLAGGYTKCNRSLSSCQIRENTHQRSGYSAMPDEGGN